LKSTVLRVDLSDTSIRRSGDRGAAALLLKVTGDADDHLLLPDL
jgi:hypothetical protein